MPFPQWGKRTFAFERGFEKAEQRKIWRTRGEGNEEREDKRPGTQASKRNQGNEGKKRRENEGGERKVRETKKLNK